MRYSAVMDKTNYTMQVELWDGYSQEFVLKRPNIEQAVEIFKIIELIGDRNLDNQAVNELCKIDFVLSMIESPDKVTAKEILESIAFLPRQLLAEIVAIENKGEATVEKQDLKTITYKVLLDGKEYVLTCTRFAAKTLHLILNQESEKSTKNLVEQFVGSLADQSSRDVYTEIVKTSPFTVLLLANKLLAAATAKVQSEKKRQ